MSEERLLFQSSHLNSAQFSRLLRKAGATTMLAPFFPVAAGQRAGGRLGTLLSGEKRPSRARSTRPCRLMGEMKR